MADRNLNHLCDYALKLSYRDLPQEVKRRTKHIIIDTVWCALGGAQIPPAKIARAAASEITSANPSTVLISGQKTSPDLAAFANGVMIRYLDFNDTYAGSPTCHPSDLLAPVLAAFTGWLVLDEPLTTYFVLGAVLVLAACVALGFREMQATE